MSLLGAGPRCSYSGPIAAQFSREPEDGWLELDEVVAENPEDERWFRDFWSDVGEDMVEGCGEGRQVFILFGRMVSEVYNSIDYGLDYDAYFEVAGEL